MNKLVQDPYSFFEEIGDLHDAKITQLMWAPFNAEVAIVVDDINANSLGLPEYRGKEPSRLIFKGIENLKLNCNATERDTQRIYELQIQKDEASMKHKVEIYISPSGKLSFEFDAFEITGV